jgi:hypothetical protein
MSSGGRVASSSGRTFPAAQCAFFLQDVSELANPERCFPLTATDFARVNPNTGTAPIFRMRRDAALTTAIYSRLPVLVDRSSGEEVKAWPVRYPTMFHMTNPDCFAPARSLKKRKELIPFAATDSAAFQANGFRFIGIDHDACGAMIESLHHLAFITRIGQLSLNRRRLRNIRIRIGCQGRNFGSVTKIRQ